jgi:hypothetical protein
MNSLNTCIAPCTELTESDEMRPMSEFNKSGYSSGQSELAIEDTVWALGGINIDQIWFSKDARRMNESCCSDLKAPGRWFVVSGLSPVIK